MADETMVDDVISRVGINETAIKTIRESVGINETAITSIGRRLETTETAVTSIRRRLETTETAITSIGERLETTETAVTSIGGRLETTETAVTSFGGRLRIIRGNIESVEERVAEIKTEIIEIKRVKATETLVIKYGEDKKALIKARDEVVATHGKLHDQLNSIHTGSLSLLGILLTFTLLFYSHTPSPGTKMMPTEFIARMVLVVANSVVICIFVFLVKEKIESINEQMHALDKWFWELKRRFIGLTMSGDGRGMELHALEIKNPRASEELYGHYKWASEYDILGKDKRISGMEVEEFNRSEWRRSSSTTYSNWYLVAVIIFTIISAIFMVVVSIFDLNHVVPDFSHVGSMSNSTSHLN